MDEPLGAATPRALGLARIIAGQARDLVADYALLAVLDARSAAFRFARLLSIGLVVAVLVVTAWLAGVVAAVVWVIGTGVSWPAALAAAAAVNLIVALALVIKMRRLMTELPFGATLRQLRGEPFTQH